MGSTCFHDGWGMARAGTAGHRLEPFMLKFNEAISSIAVFISTSHVCKICNRP
jgi:hypothetical protein